MDSRRKAMLARALLASFAVVASGLAIEAAAWAWLGSPVRSEARSMVLSYPNWRGDGDAVRYAEDTSIRVAALYGDEIEYDVTFRTNDLGCVDDRDYKVPSVAPVSKRYAFIGDSFTAGFHGGEAWLPRLREEVAASGRPVEFYNLGVGGIGFLQFLPGLARADTYLDFVHIVVVFITDDLRRKAWQPLVVDDKVVHCPRGAEVEQCRQKESTMLVVRDIGMGSESLRERVRANGHLAATTGPWEWLRHRSHIVAALARAASGAEPAQEETFEVDIRGWLRGLARAHPGRSVTFLHIPEVQEVKAGRYESELADQIRAAGFAYHALLDECRFERRHYFGDGHLNRAGYDELRRCAGHALGFF